MFKWIKNLWPWSKPEQRPAFRVVGDEEDPLRDEILRRAMFSTGPVFGSVNDDGTVTITSDEGQETIPDPRSESE